MSFYPTASELLDQPENELLHVHRSMRAILGYFSTALAIAGVFGLFIALFGNQALPVSLPIVGRPSLRWLMIIPFGVLIEAFRQHYDDLYILERDRIIHRGGRLSLNYEVPIVHYIDIRALTVTQSFAGRAFNYGTVGLNTAAQDGVEVQLASVYAPQELANLIDDIRRAHLEMSDE